MIIGLDWDNTFTKDVDLWQSFVLQANAKEHQVYITTSRSDDIPIEFIPDGLKGIVYCNFIAKKQATEALGIKVDIWIDDDPQWITESF